MGAIKVKNITKYYGRVCALDNISIKIEPDKIYGLLGRNGAGKSTLLNLMTNRLFPTEGEITVDGKSVVENDKAIEQIYYMTEQDLYPGNMKVKDIFYWTKEFYPTFDIEYATVLCKKFELAPDKKLRELSTGYKSIAKLITAMASNSRIIIFDEPVLGLDANHRDLFYKELLSNYMEDPKTIILSTHIIEEISNILERVIIINDRKIAIDDSTENLLKSAYCVSGASAEIDKYIAEKNCINIDNMASFKSATILGKMTDNDKENVKKLNLEITKVELQKLFIHLTGAGGKK
ncbi:ABC transporter ATP-binding protein [Acetivibrio cellulolyticus]|uniref:ABC transporter ATP-binding protein n=1 Tax=Acetivibrio cellulolyticus TaxID=35830 RepID=UPI0001E2FB77|nr:ABC transporter ATP-binding protein [Acetivibrio cellulolyticus]